MPHRHPTFGEWIVEHVRIEQAPHVARRLEADRAEPASQAVRAGPSEPGVSSPMIGAVEIGFSYDVDSNDPVEAAAPSDDRRAA